MKISKRSFLFISVFLIGVSSFSQKQFWYFGKGTGSNMANSAKGVGLYFDGTTNKPTVTSRPSMIFYESSSTVSDCDGNLLFYTDGLRIRDKSNQEMPNGTGLMSGTDGGGETGSAVNGVLSVSDPGNPNKYYVFTVGDVDNLGADGMRYSIVDMSLKGNGTTSDPLGDVLPGSKNVLLFNSSAEMLAATSNTCGDTVWVVAHSYTGDDIYAYPITSSGIGSAVVSNIGPVLAGGNGSRGSADFNPNGTKLAIGFLWPGGAHIFDFNKSNGTINNHIQVNGSGAYGSEWSPDGLKVYFNNNSGGTITQYNINTGLETVVAGTGNVAVTEVLGEMERAPDGKIYVGRRNTSNYIASIDNPNAINGSGANYVNESIDMGFPVWYSLPQQYLLKPFFNLNAKISVPHDLDTICDKGGSLQFTASPTCGTWYGIGGAVVSAEGVFDPKGLTEGVYKIGYGGVCLKDDTISIVVEDCCPSLTVKNRKICEGEPSFHVSSLVEEGLGSWELTNSPTGTGNLATFIDSVFNASNYLKGSSYVTDGDYELTHTYWNAPLSECPDSVIAIIEVDSFPRDIFTGAYPNPIKYCGNSFTIEAKEGLNYNWNPIISNTDSAVVFQDGIYHLTVNSPGENCLATDSIDLALDTTPTISINFTDSNVCNGQTVSMKVMESGLQYLWSNGKTTQEISETAAGKYEVTVLSKINGFCQATKSIMIMADNAPNSGIDLDSILICDPGNISIGANKSGLDYLWSTNEKSKDITVTSPGKYYVSIKSSSSGFCPTMDSIEVLLDIPPLAGIDVNDTVVCGAGSVSVSVNKPSLYYVWDHTSDNTQSVDVSTPDKYFVSIYSNSKGKCPTRDSVEVDLAPSFSIDFIGLGDDTTICGQNQQLLISVLNQEFIETYTWVNADEINDTSAILTDFSIDTEVKLTVTDNKGCSGVDSIFVKHYCEIEEPYLPNVFTPNGDGTNEMINPVNFPQPDWEDLIEQSTLTIYNRWGLKMFVSYEYPVWDGIAMNSNSFASPGTYYWVLNYTDANGLTKDLNGFFHLLK